MNSRSNPTPAGGQIETHKLLPLGVLIPVVLALGIALALVWGLGGTSVQGAATLTVTSTADGGAGSLRQAISDAASGDTVSIPAGTYTLTLGTELIIDKSLTLNGDGSGTTIIQAAASSADATSRVFRIFSGNNVAISDVTVRNGNASPSNGGGIQNAGTLTLTRSTVSGNKADTASGGIDNLDTLTVASSTVSHNSSHHVGGGIWNQGALTVIDSDISGNTTGQDGGIGRGGGIGNGGAPATMTVTNTTVSGNTANVGGGSTSRVPGSGVTRGEGLDEERPPRHP